MVLQMQSVDKIRLSNCVRMLPEEMKFENAMQGIKFALEKIRNKAIGKTNLLRAIPKQEWCAANYPR